MAMATAPAADAPPSLPTRSSDLCDQQGSAAQLCEAAWQSYGGRASASGRIQTLRCHEDAGLLRQTLETAGGGRLLVVDAGASLRVAVLGDRMARIALDNGWAGLLVYGAVRDTEALASMELAVFALGRTPLRGTGNGGGALGLALQLGGAQLQPGDYLVMDPDGVVVAPQA